MTNHMDYEINKELGECYLFMGDLDKAEEYYKKAAGSNGVQPDPYLGLATIAVQRGELSNALELYHKAAALEKTDKALAGIGLVEMENQDLASAFGHFCEALDLNPENVIASYGLIQLGHVLGRLEQVVPYLANFLALAADNHDIRYSLAGVLANLERNQDAMRELEYILEHKPDHEAANELYTLLAA